MREWEGRSGETTGIIFFARSWNEWWNRAVELQWFLSSALLCHSASWVSWILFITCKPSKNKSHYSGQKALWLKGCIFYYLCLCSPQIINKALGNLALIMLPAFIALPCPRCARSVPLFGFSIISREAQTSRCTLWCTLLLPCPSSELTGLALGAPCRAARGCCWPFPSLPFPSCRICLVFNIRTIHDKETISAYLPLQK